MCTCKLLSKVLSYESTLVSNNLLITKVRCTFESTKVLSRYFRTLYVVRKYESSPEIKSQSYFIFVLSYFRTILVQYCTRTGVSQVYM